MLIGPQVSKTLCLTLSKCGERLYLWACAENCPGNWREILASATPYLKTKEKRWRTLKTLTRMNWRCLGSLMVSARVVNKWSVFKVSGLP